MNNNKLKSRLARMITLERFICAGIAILGLCVAVFTGCENQSQSQTRTWNVTLETVSHDGHTFVVSSRGGVIHHPGCACQK